MALAPGRKVTPLPLSLLDFETVNDLKGEHSRALAQVPRSGSMNDSISLTLTQPQDDDDQEERFFVFFFNMNAQKPWERTFLKSPYYKMCCYLLIALLGLCSLLCTLHIIMILMEAMRRRRESLAKMNRLMAVASSVVLNRGGQQQQLQQQQPLQQPSVQQVRRMTSTVLKAPSVGSLGRSSCSQPCSCRPTPSRGRCPQQRHWPRKTHCSPQQSINKRHSMAIFEDPMMSACNRSRVSGCASRQQQQQQQQQNACASPCVLVTKSGQRLSAVEIRLEEAKGNSPSQQVARAPSVIIASGANVSNANHCACSRMAVVTPETVFGITDV